MSDMYTDEDIDDLVRINIELTKENNRILKGMRSSQRWHTFFRIIWLGLLIGGPILAYYLYLEPYVEDARVMYEEAQQNLEHMRELENNLQASMGEMSTRLNGAFGRE